MVKEKKRRAKEDEAQAEAERSESRREEELGKEELLKHWRAQGMDEDGVAALMKPLPVSFRVRGNVFMKARARACFAHAPRALEAGSKELPWCGGWQLPMDDRALRLSAKGGGG